MDFEAVKKRLQQRQRNILGHENALKSAVLVPLIKEKNEWRLLFEVRSHQLRRQPGEICFPGGRIDPGDRDDRQAAIRETCEELQISAHSIEWLGALDIFVPSQFFLVYPHVGLIRGDAKIYPNHREVEEVFTVPLSWLKTHKPKLHHLELEVKKDQDFPFELIPGGKDYDFRKNKIPEYFYFYKDRMIWGLTARILHHFLELL